MPLAQSPRTGIRSCTSTLEARKRLCASSKCLTELSAKALVVLTAGAFFVFTQGGERALNVLYRLCLQGCGKFAEKIHKKSSRRLAIHKRWCIVCVLTERERVTPLLKIGDEPTTSHKGVLQCLPRSPPRRLHRLQR